MCVTVVLFCFVIFAIISIAKGDADLQQSVSLRCYHGSMQNYSVASLNRSIALLQNSSCYNSSRPAVFYTFGYTASPTHQTAVSVVTAYVLANEFNVFLLDWTDLAANVSKRSDLDYLLNAAPHAKLVGERFAETMVEWMKGGFPLNRTHLVGHSLGCHLFGSAGRHLQELGYMFPRITGLDPSELGFEPEDIFGIRLQVLCAKFVDIIHTSPGFLGIKHSYGTVDIWVNYDGRTDAIQPGCPMVDYRSSKSSDVCSHRRAASYYGEAVSRPRGFPAVGAANVTEWLHGRTTSASTGGQQSVTFLGEETNLTASGDYYLTTNSEAPYGKGETGLLPHTSFYTIDVCEC